LSAIGDVVHTLPALNAIRQRYPDANITWLVEEAASDFVTGHKALDRVIVSKRKRWIKRIFSSACLQNIREVSSFLKELRDVEYDMVIDFQTLFKSGILVGLSRGKRKIGYGQGLEHMEYSYIFLNERIPAVNMNRHAILRSLMLLDKLKIPSDKIAFDLPVSDQDRISTNKLLEKHRLKVLKPLVIINPVARWQTKLWESKKFARLADSLAGQHGAAVAFTGSPNDRGKVGEIISAMQRPAANLAGHTTLKMLAAIFESADLVISTDTGPMHIAAATNTPVVALFGPTAPWRTGPFGPNHQVVRADLECSPCFKRQCKTTDCMKKISCRQVLQAATAAINNIEIN